jgi:hypothetical protein
MWVNSGLGRQPRTGDGKSAAERPYYPEPFTDPRTQGPLTVLQGSGVCFVSSSDLQGLHRQPSPAFCHPHQASSSVQSTYHSSINIPQFNQHTAVQTTTSNHHFKPPLQTTTSTYMAISRGLTIVDLVNPSTPTKRFKYRDLLRDDRIKVRGLQQYGRFTYVEIARRTNFS